MKKIITALLTATCAVSTVCAAGWQQGKNMTEKVALAAVQLKNSLQVLPTGDKNGRSALAGTMKKEISTLIAQQAVNGNFEVVQNYSNGVLARVMASNRSSVLKKESLVYVQDFLPVFQIFSETIYPTGTLAKLEKYGNVHIWSKSSKQAAMLAMTYIADYAGDKSLSSVDLPVGQTNAAAVAAIDENTAAADVYHVFEDDYNRSNYRVNRRDRKYRVKNSCGKVFYIDQEEYDRLNRKGLIENPIRHGKPGRPGRPGRPEKPVKPPKPRPELNDTPLVQRSEGSRQSPGILPESYKPGNVNIKTKLPRW